MLLQRVRDSYFYGDFQCPLLKHRVVEVKNPLSDFIIRFRQRSNFLPKIQNIK